MVEEVSSVRKSGIGPFFFFWKLSCVWRVLLLHMWRSSSARFVRVTTADSLIHARAIKVWTGETLKFRSDKELLLRRGKALFLTRGLAVGCERRDQQHSKFIACVLLLNSPHHLPLLITSPTLPSSNRFGEKGRCTTTTRPHRAKADTAAQAHAPHTTLPPKLPPLAHLTHSPIGHPEISIPNSAPSLPPHLSRSTSNAALTPPCLPPTSLST